MHLSLLKRRRVLVRLLSIILLFLVLPYAGRGLFQLLVVNEKPIGGNAIVVLLGGKRPERVRTAFTLYQKGFAPIIAFGAGYQARDFWGASEEWVPAGQRYERFFLKAGVPARAIEMVNTRGAYDTESELSVIREHAIAKKWSRLILVSTSSHTRRVSMIWKRVAPEIPAVTIAANDPKLLNWWTSIHGINTIFREYAAMGKEFIRRLVR